MKLKELRTRFGYTQADVAERMNTTQQTVARWESGKTTLNVDQIRDLCLLLSCTAEALLGWDTDLLDRRDSPFSIAEADTPYGTLEIQFGCGKHYFPIGEKARHALHTQLGNLSLGEDNGDNWLQAWTLDNKILLLNPSQIQSLKWFSDDVMAMPDFENPEVYRALEEIETGSLAGEMARTCLEIVEQEGEEEVGRMTEYGLALRIDGVETWFHLSEDVASEFEEMVFQPPRCGRQSFFLIESDGYYETSFVNLGQLAMLQVPMNRYRRLTAPED